MTNYVRNVVRCERMDLIQKYFLDEKGNFSFKKVIPRPEWMGCEPVSTIEPHEVETWFDWNCRHWGTKWDACTSRFYTDDYENECLEFDTAWAMPEPVLKELAKLIDSDVEVDYAYEDCTHGATVTYHSMGQETVDIPDDMEEFCYSIWPEYRDEEE